MDINEFKGKSTVVIGGLGFIGSNLSIKLVEFGAEVTIIDSKAEGTGFNEFNISPIRDKISLIIADMSDPKIMDCLTNADYVFNLAGHLSHVRSMKDPLYDLKLNLTEQLEFLELFKKSGSKAKIIYTGTRGQYGSVSNLPVKEDTKFNFVDINGINKATAEYYHLLYEKIHNIKTISLRLTNVFGPRHQMKDSTQGFISHFIKLAMEGQDITIFGDGEQKRDFLYVDDAIDAILTAALSDISRTAFNVGSGKPISVLEIAKNITNTIEKSNLKLIPFPEEHKKIEVGDFYLDISKIKEKLNWEPKISFEEGLKRMIDYYNKNKEFYW